MKIKHKIDISFFINDLRTGGAQKMVVELANGFADRGYEIELVLMRKEGAFINEVNDQVDIKSLEAESLRSCTTSLIQYVNQTKTKYLFTSMKLDNLVAIVSVKLSRSDTSNIICITNIPSNAKYTSIKSKPIPYLEKLLYPRSDFLLAVSKTSLKDAETFYDTRLDGHVYAPINIDHIQTKATQPIINEWFPLDRNEPIFLAAGRLSKEKDYETLIRAFDLVLNQIPAKLIILGDGKEKKSLLNISSNLGIDSKVEIPGFVENPYPYMKNADVFVHSSKTDAGSYVLLEAMACKTPVVSTASGGPNEVLNNGEFGLLVPVGDHKKLGKAMVKTLEDPTSPDTLLKRAAQFDKSMILDKYEQILFKNINSV